MMELNYPEGLEAELLELFKGSESLLDAFVQSAPIAFWLRDTEGVMLLKSDFVLSLFGRLENFPYTNELMGEEGKREWNELFQKCLHGKHMRAATALMTIDGEEKTFDHHLIPVVDNHHPFAVLEIFLPRQADY